MPTIDDVRAAAERISDVAFHTPTFTATSLGALYGMRSLRVKAEVFQRTGSFKLRGALNAVRLLTGEQRAGGLGAMSAGNHAAALAYAARAAGTTATIVMPTHASPAKVAATQAYGGEVVLTDQPLVDALTALVAERGLTLVHPFDDPAVVAGQGTVGLELLADGPAPDLVVVQAGGGGLLSGVATVVKALHPDTRVVGVEPETADVISRSLAAGQPVTMTPVSVADGLCSPIGGTVTLPIIRERVDEMVRVGEDAIRAALRVFLERTKLLVEPSGAAGLAPFVSGQLDGSGLDVALVATGGNVDPAAYAGLLA